MEEGGSCSPSFGSSYTKHDTHSKEMEETESLHLLLRVEQIQGQAESSSTAQERPKESSLAGIMGGSYSGRRVLKEGQR